MIRQICILSLIIAVMIMIIVIIIEIITMIDNGKDEGEDDDVPSFPMHLYLHTIQKQETRIQMTRQICSLCIYVFCAHCA